MQASHTHGGVAWPNWRALLATPVVAGALLACLTFFFCGLRLSDPDTWWHLKAGQEIWQSGSIPTTDHWSFTVHGNAWTAHEWLAEISIYLAYTWGGLAGLQLWVCCLAATIVAAVYTLCYRYSGSATAASAGGFLAFFFGTIGFSVRPQMLGYSFLALELLILERAWSRSPRSLCLLPPLFAVWVNCHGSYPLGLVLAGVAAVCWHRTGRGPDWKLSGAVIGVSAAALFLNPVGIRLLEYPLNVFTHQRASLGFLAEWQPTTMSDVRGMGVYAVLGALMAAGLTGRFRANAFELIATAIGAIMALQHVRMMFVFGILVAPIVARMSAGWRPVSRPARQTDLSINGLFLAAGVLCTFLAFPGEARRRADVDSRNPVKAVAFLKQSSLPGPLLNDYAWGGYLIWALPERKVFVDGRGDVFDWAGLMAKYRDWSLVQADPAMLLDEYKIGLCLIPAGSPISHALDHLANWRKVHSDDFAVVYAREFPTPPVS